MPTGTVRSSTRGASFAVRLTAWAIGLFGLLRLAWIETWVLLPVTRLQGSMATALTGAPARPIDVTLACSGADALAICAAAVLAYPVAWRSRLGAVAGGAGVMLALNTIRIASLGRAIASPAWFNVLHLYLWPAILTLAIAAYVFGWMQFADRQPAAACASDGPTSFDGSPRPTGIPTRRFVLWTMGLLALFIAGAPQYIGSATLLSVAAFVARATTTILAGIGVEASTTGSMLVTARGAFLVTQECIATPLIPVYLAAVIAYSSTWRWRLLGAAAALPLFVGLGIARLLVVAVPSTVLASPLFVVHAFYQLVTAGVVVAAAALWCPAAGAWRRAVLGAAAGCVVAGLLGPPTLRVLAWAFSGGTSLDDPQGAIALLAPFQYGLLVALSVAAFAAFRWRVLAAGVGLLGVTQLCGFAALHFALDHAGPTPSVRDVRAWALAAPLLIVTAIIRYDRPR